MNMVCMYNVLKHALNDCHVTGMEGGEGPFDIKAKWHLLAWSAQVAKTLPA